MLKTVLQSELSKTNKIPNQDDLIQENAGKTTAALVSKGFLCQMGTAERHISDLLSVRKQPRHSCRLSQ